MNTEPPLGEYFHYPITKSKEYSRLRQLTTDRYGAIATVVLVVVVLLIPLYNYLNIYGPFRRISIMRPINHKLNAYIYTGEALRAKRHAFPQIKAAVASRVKSLIFKVSYHAGSIIQIVFWISLLSSLSLVDLYHGDLIFLAKRLGRVSAVCLPTVLFLSIRPSPLPKTLYLNLLPIHKTLSRIIIIQAIIHTVLYCGFFQKKNTWAKALKTENLYGWASILGFVIIIITSLLKLRNRYYRLFYINHYAWSWIIVICLQFHIRPTKFTPYTILNLSILVGQIAYRVWLTKGTPTKLDLKVITVSPCLLLVEFPNNLISNKAKNPGAHIRLTKYHSSFIKRWYNQIIPEYHPYTLASLPQDNFQKLIIRPSTFQILNDRKYLICGSYDPHLLFINSKNKESGNFSISKLSINAKRVLIVVGGSAISFALPILRVMNYHGIPVKIIWVIKDFRDINILKYFDGFIHGDDFEIFVTGDTELRDEDNEPRVRNRKSLASIFSKISSSSNMYNGESDPLLGQDLEDGYDSYSLDYENQIENVRVSVDVAEEEELQDDDEECAAYDNTFKSSNPHFAHEDDIDSNSLEELIQSTSEPLTRVHSNKTTSSFNDQFIPHYSENASETIQLYVQQFTSLVKRLNLEHKVYKGRPTLNYKYYNWCINEGFTQCSGPVHDDSNNLVCCRDLPKNKVQQADIDAEKIWVIGAGPQGLVLNVKVWAKEYGLKYHEESFNV
ncbi:uncharacterized protein CANTADRAFT_51427 [Suhomyces tanzawaensis NRRL Y-17324]|uniref:Ferric oxidoreductase domain-containing protein n=1 Tax=Suhomyces tanzawaensis NRRL Y-17324 TaxID=984487 RepID=A0A1E4SI73_9ASCO|nr:uncharacterized protein CANTADRAFT_51427 [Suhomyces tanzawaensis NRRL Y-17324]ODV79170.1 hypothetical protein CANTADRAFT_51427 [Suhomyces tanzawaensis NRRL Y-17324]